MVEYPACNWVRSAEPVIGGMISVYGSKYLLNSSRPAEYFWHSFLRTSHICFLWNIFSGAFFEVQISVLRTVEEEFYISRELGGPYWSFGSNTRGDCYRPLEFDGLQAEFECDGCATSCRWHVRPTAAREIAVSERNAPSDDFVLKVVLPLRPCERQRKIEVTSP